MLYQVLTIIKPYYANHSSHLLKKSIFFLLIDCGVLGDVLLHCVVDAILGALGLPDIGQIFPDSDPKWKGAASSVFIKEAVSFYQNFKLYYQLF